MQLRGRKPDFIGFKGVGGEGLNRTSTDNLTGFCCKEEEKWGSKWMEKWGK